MKPPAKATIIKHLQSAQQAAQVAEDVVLGDASPGRAMQSAFVGWQSLRQAIELLVVESVRSGELTQQQVEDALRDLHGASPTEEPTAEQ